MPKGQLRTRFRNRIAMRREALRLTQEQLAAKLGVTATTIARWEIDMRVPSPAMIGQLARALCCRAGDLYPRDFV
jgi:transcriptional regulator with XRE-family HTH domain